MFPSGFITSAERRVRPESIVIVPPSKRLAPVTANTRYAEQLRPRLAEPFATIISEAHKHGDDEGKETEHEHTYMSGVPVRHSEWS